MASGNHPNYGKGDDVKEKVREAIDIVDLVGQYVPLRRKGRVYVGLCPWHDDQRPSLTVYPERQSFKCWPCDIGGDVFDWTMRMEGVEFRESLAMLADRVGIQLKGQSKQESDELAKVYGALEKATQVYETEFWRNSQAKEYMASRGLREETLKRFRIGFAPDSYNFIARHLQEFSDNALKLAGLRREGERGDYDLFKNRILFPLVDHRNRVIGFAGRVAPDNPSDAKYINSPETLAFKKSRFLYGLDKAGTAIRKTKKLILLEGYTDVMQAHQAGIENSTAIAGTAFTDEHAAILNQKFRGYRVIMCLDGDESGRGRAFDHSRVLITRGNYGIALLPEGFDPDDFIRSEGSEGLEKVLDQATSIFEFYMDQQTQNRDLSSPEGLVFLLEDIAQDFKKVPPHLSGVYIDALAKRIGCPERAVEAAVLGKEYVPAPPEPSPEPAPIANPPLLEGIPTLPGPVREVGSRRARAEFDLLRGLIESPSAKQYFAEYITADTFTSKERLAVYQYLLQTDDDRIPLLAPLFVAETDRVIDDLRNTTPGLDVRKLRNILLSPKPQRKLKLPDLEERIVAIIGDDLSTDLTHAVETGHSLESIQDAVDELKRGLE